MSATVVAARVAVESIIQEMYREFAPTKSRDLLPSEIPKHRSGGSPNGSASANADGIAQGDGRAGDINRNSVGSSQPPTMIIGDYVLDPTNWTHQLQQVATSTTADTPCFAVTFTQPLRSRPIPAATATLWFTYHSAQKVTVRVESMAFLHTYVPKPGSNDGNQWVHEGSINNIKKKTTSF